jgi:hypothetical protein
MTSVSHTVDPLVLAAVGLANALVFRLQAAATALASGGALALGDAPPGGPV